MHQTIEPSILYFGTPVIVVSSLNPDGSTNLAPISSAWWLGWSCMLGFDASSQTVANLRRHGECVLNLAAEQNLSQVDKLALLTGRASVPLHKKALGSRYCCDKFAAAGFTAQPSDVVLPDRVRECPIQLEARVNSVHGFGNDDPRMSVAACAIEVTIERIHALPELCVDGRAHHVDPDKWRPLLMSFRHFYGLSARLQDSRLARGDEEQYAPWKQGGLKGIVTNGVLRLAKHKHRIKKDSR